MNPLIETNELPDFDAIQPEHVAPALTHCLDQYQRWLDSLDSISHPNWEAVAVAEEKLGDQIDRLWAPVSQFHAVSPESDWHDVYAENVIRLSEFVTEVNQHQGRLKAYQAIKNAPDFANRSAAERKLVDNTLRELHLAGVDLPPDQQARFKEVSSELTELSTTFEQNTKQATDAWSKHIADAEALAGLPDQAIAMAADRARDAGVEGYQIGLDHPSVDAILTYADDRDLRREVYDAYCTRASDQGPHAGGWDNEPLIQKILTLRLEKSRILGFDRFQELSLARKMAGNPREVIAFLEDLAQRAKPKAERDLEELEAFAERSLEPWDVAYYSEKLRISRYSVSEEEIRPYFPVDRSLVGLFTVAERLFGVRFKERTDVSVWHPDVRFFDVLDLAGQPIAGFYADLFARKGKRGGAWMADCRSRSHFTPEGQRAIAMLNCNFPPPGEDRPSLLSHEEVVTLFHEFGHGLHHMLTRVEHPSIGGISGVEWDAVELPSQFMENYTWEYAALAEFARHFETGETLPKQLFQRMDDARHFQSGLFLVRQLEFALADFLMHGDLDESSERHAFKILDQVREQVAVIKPPAYNRFLCSFGHIFSGGYAAGYYSYLWAEQLSADAFSRFKDEGVFNPDTGASFRREVLEVGGSRPAAESFFAFRGRAPKIDALLETYGV